MQGANPVTQSFESRRRWSFWIAGIVALAAVAALTACASQGPAPPGLTPTPVPGGEKTVITHNVTIRPLDANAGGACTVDPTLLQDVDLEELVRFKNELSDQPVQLFDLPPELFGVTTMTVPPGSSVSLQVSTQAQRGNSYPYSVSCLPPAQARPRIVIRSTSSD